jgi:nucleoid-associated protein EbfC
MLGNMGDLLKQAKAMQENMAKAQAEVAQLSATGEAGGGMVKVTMNGKHVVSRVKIEPQLMGEDREMLEDLLTAAINDATSRIDAVVQQKMSGLMAGLPLPPGMKLPF